MKTDEDDEEEERNSRDQHQSFSSACVGLPAGHNQFALCNQLLDEIGLKIRLTATDSDC